MTAPTPYLADADVTLWHGDVLDVLRGMDADSVDCVVTSPPYWGLRSYLDDGHDDKPLELGLEPTPDAYVARMVDVFREVRRVLCAHGTCWVNLGSSYSSGDRDGHGTRVGAKQGTNRASAAGLDTRRPPQPAGFKPKDMVPIPWMVAMALQQDGWYLRADIIWAKPNPMPESVTDRPTKAHEYVFLLTKQPRYFFDQEAVREPAEWAMWGGQSVPKYNGTATATGWMEPKTKAEREEMRSRGRNVRSVWTIATQPYPEAHFATYPEELVRRCVLAGCPERVCRTCGKASERILADSPEYTEQKRRLAEVRDDQGEDWLSGRGNRAFSNTGGVRADVVTTGWSDCGHNDWRPGVVLDPFVGSGTTCLVARNHGRHSVGIDLNEQYLALAATRLQQLSLLTGEAHASQ